MWNHSRSLVVVSALLLASCSTEAVDQRSTQEWDPEGCNHQNGYERGYNDATQGKAMDTRFGRRCREDLRAETYEGYREGFDSATKRADERAKAEREERERQASLPPTNPQEEKIPPRTSSPWDRLPNINVNIGGRQEVGGRQSDQARADNRSYYCKAKAFMSEFEGFGPTQLEARRSAVQSCTARYHKMHCDQVECQKNE